jgi:hypothetical protein
MGIESFACNAQTWNGSCILSVIVGDSLRGRSVADLSCRGLQD